jgi:transposase
MTKPTRLQLSGRCWEGKKVSYVAKALGILPTMLSRWVYEYQTHGEDAFSGNGVPIRNADWEIKRLQKRLEELEMENEILKKFQAYLDGYKTEL